MSYLHRACAVALSVIGIIVILVATQATGKVAGQHRNLSFGPHAAVVSERTAYVHRREHRPAKRHRHVKLPRDYRAWSRVADCESGGWQVLNSAYPDPVGITRTNYVDSGGKPLPVARVSLRERVAVIRAADRLIRHYGMAIPDRDGCAGW